MRPLDIQPIGGELAIKWEDGSESFVSLEKLRRFCPCAGCKGEVDIMGTVAMYAMAQAGGILVTVLAPHTRGQLMLLKQK